MLADLRAGLDEVARRVPGDKLGAVGFCFGGGMVWRLLAGGEARLAAAVPCYGPAPEQPDFRRAKAAVLAVCAERDSRANASKDAADATLAAAGLTRGSIVYPEADHAFFNDTAARDHEVAAGQAWQAITGWFGRYL